jgi:aminoglycoside phosphotransferase (APT) family kinase protein
VRVRPNIGPELSSVSAGVGVPLVSMIPLTRWPSAVRRRGAWRLRFADGSVLKGVLFDSPAAADRVELILRALGDRHFPQVLARGGAAMLLPWVEQRAFSNHPFGPAELRRCAQVQGWMHSLDAAHLSGAGADTTESWWTRLEAASEHLEQQGGRLSTDARRLLVLAREHSPTRTARGIVHGDLCAENIVVQSPERLFVVDNETLHVAAPDYDLARTWYRWPMLAADWRRYLSAYAEQRSPAQFEAHFVYWAALVLIESARWHLMLATGGAGIPLRRLRALARRIYGAGAGGCR